VRNIAAVLLTLFAAIGLGLVVYGIIALNKDVTCGTQVMKPGQSCVSASGGSWDYEQQRAKNQRQAWLTIGGGAAVLLMCGAGAGWSVRRNRRASAPQAAA
jgi:hypothetical protein